MTSDTVELILNEKNKVTVWLHGATITSFISNGEEILFVSKNSIFDNNKAIRGGIPVVFPNFGPWALGPQHGFARTSKWSVKSPVESTDNSCTLTLSLSDNDSTRSIWNYKFELEYQLTLSGNSLKTNLVIHNKDEKEFDFTSLLHTYLRLDDIRNAAVNNLTDCDFMDKVNNGLISKETRELVQIAGETDRVYFATKNEHTVLTGNSNKMNIVIKKENFPDTVVWNPWVEKAKAMSDFGDDEYNTMICVEAGYVQNRCILKPSETTVMGQEIVVELNC